MQATGHKDVHRQAGTMSMNCSRRMGLMSAKGELAASRAVELKKAKASA